MSRKIKCERRNGDDAIDHHGIDIGIAFECLKVDFDIVT